jgi:hypothetical protein
MRPSRDTWISVAVCVMAIAACTGNVHRADLPGASGSAGRSGGGTTGTAAGGSPSVPLPPADPTACSVDQPGTVALRRLTRAQYDRTMADLLGDASHPAAAFPADDSVLADQSQVSSLFFAKHEAAVEALVTAAWQRELQGKQPASAKLQVCVLASGGKTCARQIVAAFARRAWRRPVAADELAPYYDLVDGAVAAGDDLGVGVQLALRAVLLAPDFLFRIELDGAAANRALESHELATRLSYWLWSSTPDARLDELADAGKLTDPAVLASELGRMLGDPKAAAFAEDFLDHWLSLSDVLTATPDKTLFPKFDAALASSMASETRRLFRAFVEEDRKFVDLMDADFTFGDDALARHYGLTPAGPADGSNLRKLSLPPGPRRGLLAQASLLTLTSPSTHTSPVKRGKFVLARLMCDKPPPPPPGVNTKLDPPAAGESLTPRQQLDRHRTQPTCASCHNVIDPIGLALEHFDPVGQYRDRYGDGSAIDTSGQLAGGGTFTTFEDLRALLKRDDRFSACIARQMFVYAIGREPGDADACAQSRIATAFAKGGRLGDLIGAIAGNPAFLQRRGVAPGGEL